MKYGLIAEAVSHSYSAEIHKKLFGYDYELKAIKKEELESFLKTKDFNGINVTIPYKTAVMIHLDYVNQNAMEIGAVNTIVNRDNMLSGYNTDFMGLTDLIIRNKIDLKGKKVLILGSGGTSKTANAVAKSLLANQVLNVSRQEKEGFITYEQAKNIHKDADVIINTTPVGMYPEIDKSPIEISQFQNLSAVVDVIYNPLRSKLVMDARNLGIKAVGGLYMLVSQAAFAGELFLDKTIEKSKVCQVYKEILKEKENIVLIGMPGCGKSSTGRKIAELSGKEFIDTDIEIYKETGKRPAEIINEFGEAKFRDIEEAVIKKIAVLNNCVISTGGGAVLRSNNVDLLKKNGRIYCINRNIDDIKPTATRPLTQNRQMLQERYDERYPIYLKWADVCVNPVDGIWENAKMIMEEFYENSCN